MIPLEIERKFLIRQTAELDSACCERMDITQTYLIKNEANLQRRVRTITKDGITERYYTEKRFISAAVREENERTVSAEEYDKLIKERDTSLVPVIKTRRILMYNNQRFEIDSYAFSDIYATMELEIDSVNTPIDLPPFVDVVKEVTGNHDYSNAVLAAKIKFPEEE